MRTLGLDLDGTVALGYHQAVHAELVARSLIDLSTPVDPPTYDLAVAYGVSRRDLDTVIAAVSARGDAYRYAVADPAGIACVRALAAVGIRVRVVTARREQVARETTLAWIMRAGLPADDVVFTEDKASAEFDLLLDDMPAMVASLHAVGRDAVLLDRPWNRDSDLERITWEGLPARLVSPWAA